MWPSREDNKQGVDDIFLSHKDGNKEVRDDGVGDLSGIRLMCHSESDEDRHVGHECYAEKSSVDREEYVAQVANGFRMPLLNMLLFQVAFPAEVILLGYDTIG